MIKSGALEIISGPMFSGKCLGKDTPVLMFNGSVKNVQDIRVGDLLMGDDSTSRTVKSVTVGSGELYKVSPEFTEPYVVNDSHILSVSDGVSVMNIPVKEYIDQTEEFKTKYRGYRATIDYPETTISNAFGKGMEYGISGSREIPTINMVNSSQNRELFFIGYIQAVKHSFVNGRMVISHYDKSIVSLARSIGYNVIVENNEMKFLIKPDVYGRLILQFDKTGNLDSLEIENIGIGSYYGFELNGNHRFVLGNYSVTHNTTELLRRITIESEIGMKVLYINNSLDTRSPGSFSSHNPMIGSYKLSGIDTIYGKTLKDIENKINVSDYDVIGIDEGQFFPDIDTCAVEWVNEKNIHVIVAGLTSDCEKKPFGKISLLEPDADTYTKLTSFCKECAKEKKRVKAIFTYRFSESENQTDVGGKDKYSALCRGCYNDFTR